MTREPRGRNWDTAQKVAAHVLMNLNEERTGGATHYHATYVDPIWSAGLIKTDKIGLHIFYRFPRGAEWAQVRQNYNRKRERVITAAAEADVNAAATSVIKTTDDAKVEKVAMNAPAPTLSPASVTTSTRTITNGAPKFNTMRKSSEVSDYTAAQVTQAAVRSSASAAGAMN